MKIVRKIKQVKRLAKRKEDENWNFRAYFRAEIDQDDLDEIVHALNEQVSAQIDCTRCGHCCTEITPLFDQEDMTRFAEGLDISVTEFRKKYLISAEHDPGMFRFDGFPCPFLKNKKCTNYSHRPKDCVGYPYLDKPNFRGRSMNAVMNCEVCPIVYNVYEGLKEHFDDWQDEVKM
ncbi:YkgJ family cysteine cluster protein [Anaerolineales bacterium HSG6]|nr:YkgJ family cysteine cluster protein [Anaerolineales bacterium HSG6]MDM8531873.1 YkgJ family cysteine cluster protein [Anaerolineales bacterium HSG25]